MATNLSKIPNLPPGMRLAAQQQAASNTLKQHGSEPSLADFTSKAVSDYPTWFRRLTTILLLTVLFAAANVSIFRVFKSGRDNFITSINDLNQAAWVGLMTFLMAEFMVVVSVIARNTLYTDERTPGRLSRRDFLWIPITLGFLMAVFGNWNITNPKLDAGQLMKALWELCDTLVPPLAVLFMSFILETLILSSIRERHQSTSLYLKAMDEFKQIKDHPENSPHYQRELAIALKAAIIMYNKRGKGAEERTELLTSLSDDDWRNLVLRELKQGEWFEVPQSTSPLALTTTSLETLQTNLSQSSSLVSENGHSPSTTSSHPTQT